jgi:small-conductance mechanosensitive channel
VIRTYVLDYSVPAAVLLAGFLLGLVLRYVVISRLGRRARETRSWFDDQLVAGLAGFVLLGGALVGLYVALDLATLPSPVERVAQRVLLVLSILAATWVTARLASAWVRQTAEARAGLLPGASLITNLVRIAVLGIGVLVMLQTLGISITPVITALGIGGLAVALALQDTLANLFAGIHLLATRQVRPGDFVRLETGEEGYVHDITWRYTTVRQLPNDMVIVPNAKLAGSITTNYSLPDSEEAVLVGVGVSYASDLSRVEQITVEVAREIQRDVPGAVPQFEPFIRYHAFADSSVSFNVILRAHEVVDQHLMRHEFIKRLHARYASEGIEIPFPQRTLHVGAAVRSFLKSSDSS